MAAKSALNPVSDKLDRTVGSARDAARSARDTAANARDTYAAGLNALPEIARTAQKVFSDGIDQLRSQGEDAAGAASDQFDDARHYVVDRVQERPFAATLAALGAGFVLGLLFAGNRR